MSYRTLVWWREKRKFTRSCDNRGNYTIGLAQKHILSIAFSTYARASRQQQSKKLKRSTKKKRLAGLWKC